MVGSVVTQGTDGASTNKTVCATEAKHGLTLIQLFELTHDWLSSLTTFIPRN
ncbi:hypothetical protein VCHA39O220_30103 [Vibrio chagasii]|nr:hypothetical protein VCHA34P121_20248 [Vibrio chagasii]CAH6897838.1 hypothetical protein VCHA34P120_20166 [Vibrio chagasii]CAH6898744.1 hypothetical protein VCHA34P131_30433 [Vibrio chagasii]CAH6960305.1 hypothetical protein VCHA36O157_40193 [Vibrio chagasii]CAH6979946.1 hypothetical protein VCHA37P191_140080 [Vibrio chagasii]